MSAARRLALAGLVASCLLRAGRAWAAGGSLVEVIPPGVEPLVMTMVGGDASGPPLPASCALTGASIDRSHIVATYDCAGRVATIDLRHPRDSEGGVARAHTAEFVVLADEKTPPALIDEIALRIRAHESAWHWVTAEANAAPRPGEPATRDASTISAAPPPHRFFASPRSFGGATLAIAALTLILDRLARRRRR